MNCEMVGLVGSILARPECNWADETVAERQISSTQIIVCPVCGFDYNHLRPPQSLSGWESSENVSAPPAYCWSGRGDGLVVPIEGECGHRWAICLGFHKGQSFMFAIDDS